VEEPVSLVSKPEQPEQTVQTEQSEFPVPAEGGAAAPGSMRAGIEAAIDAIRPALQMDGGDVTLLNVDESTGVVDIELIGACVGCPASTMTLKAGIERILKDRVEGITEVNAAGLEPAFDF
jgi:Fe-S cluster biogenesis protein NfuA